MPIDLKKCCSMHSKEKENRGECCQQSDQEAAEALTYEQSFVNTVHSVVYMDEKKEKHE